MEITGKKPTARVAVVTGANKRIGLEIVKQLAGHGINTVVFTARDVKRGTDATSRLHQMGLRNVVFHQLDVLDSLSISNLAEFIGAKFGVLDILLSGKAAHLVENAVKHTYEKAEKCLKTNFYGVKATTKALLTLLKLSTHGASVVNISSLMGELQVRTIHSFFSRVRRLSIDFASSAEDSKRRREKRTWNLETLNEVKLDAILERFLEDCKDDNLKAGGWPLMLPAGSCECIHQDPCEEAPRDENKLRSSGIH